MINSKAHASDQSFFSHKQLPIIHLHDMIASLSLVNTLTLSWSDIGLDMSLDPRNSPTNSDNNLGS